MAKYTEDWGAEECIKQARDGLMSAMEQGSGTVNDLCNSELHKKRMAWPIINSIIVAALLASCAAPDIDAVRSE
jgi:hypothetical protein